mgnify:CR=1 FL=1
MLTVVEQLCVVDSLDEMSQIKISKIFEAWRNFKLTLSTINQFSNEDILILQEMFGTNNKSSPKLSNYNKTLIEYNIYEIFQVLNKQMSYSASFLGMTKYNNYTLNYQTQQGYNYTSPFLKQIEILINQFYYIYDECNKLSQLCQFANFDLFQPMYL